MNRLPTEIVHSILQHVSPKELFNFALVCKAWVIPAQLAIYTNVTINSESQLKKFYKSVQRNNQLGDKVQSLDLKFKVSEYYGILEEVIDLYSNLLPNLKEIHECNSYIYGPVLNALLNSSLKRLKRLQPPTDRTYGAHLKNYVDCVNLMKDRLENISINEKLFTSEPGLKDLYNELSKFEKVEEVEIELESNTIIEVLEHVTEKCKIVKNILLRFDPPYRYEQTNDLLSIAELSKYAPNESLKSLWCDIQKYSEPKLLSYIIHKFPQLDNLVLLHVVARPIPLDFIFFKCLLNFISNIDTVTLNRLSLDRNNATNFTSNFWEAFENTKIGDCQIRFGTEIKIKIAIKGREHASAINLIYEENGLDFDWQFFMHFVEKGGKFIHKLKFYFTQNSAQNSYHHEVPDDFIPHMLKHCTNLEKMQLERCVLIKMSYADDDFTSKGSLKELCLKNCMVSNEIFGKISGLLCEVNQLNLSSIFHVHAADKASPEPPKPIIKINMLETRIDTIIFEDFWMAASVYIKILAATHGNRCQYYRFDAKGFGCVEVESNEKEYNKSNNGPHIYLCCQTKPEIKFR